MIKEYTKKNMSSYVVLVLLLPKKGWNLKDVCWLSSYQQYYGKV
jgi:hypothetical protein